MVRTCVIGALAVWVSVLVGLYVSGEAGWAVFAIIAIEIVVVRVNPYPTMWALAAWWEGHRRRPSGEEDRCG